MAKSAGRNIRGQKLTYFSPHFLELFHECFTRYRAPKERQRLLAGIDRDKAHNRMTVLNAVIFICFVTARRKWARNEWRMRNYKDARWRSQYDPQSAVRFYDTVTVRRQSTINEIKRIEALLALRLSLVAGYATHSRTLWRCFERALCTEAMGSPSRKATPVEVDELFASIRLSLYNQRKKRSIDELSDAAAAIYRELRLKLNDKKVSRARDKILINAAHRAP